jgi:hypothetical protein
LQELIEGIEVTVPIIGEQAFPVVEIIPPEGKEFDFVNKYNGQTAENCPPKLVSVSTQKKAQDIAIKLHNLMGCRDISRTNSGQARLLLAQVFACVGSYECHPCLSVTSFRNRRFELTE